MKRLLSLVATGVAVMCAGAVPAVAAPVGHRAYDATALAVPFNPEAGSHGSPIPARLFTTRADVSNPPRAASARAARTDLGLLEQFVPEPALGPAADASTRDRNNGHHARTTDGSAVYTAHADRSPFATATATAAGTRSGAVTIGTLLSTSVARQVGTQLTATAETTMSGLAVGPLSAGAASYHAVATTDGARGGAHATGIVTVTDATVAGVPVVVSQDGVRVDSSHVSVGALNAAAKAVADAFARSGYFDVRLVQPTSTKSKDGSAAEVDGGGLELIGRSDSQQSYFVAATLLSGDVSVAAGDSLAALGVGSSGPLIGRPTAHAPTSVPAVAQPRAVAPDEQPAKSAPPPQVSPLYSHAASEVGLPGTWSGWPVLLGVAVGLLIVGVVLRRRLALLANAVADRYVRG